MRQSAKTYVKLYLSELSKLSGLPKSANAVLFCLIRQANVENTIYLSSPIKKRMAAKVGITIATLDNQLNKLLKKKLLLRVDRSTFLLNPILFAK